MYDIRDKNFQLIASVSNVDAGNIMTFDKNGEWKTKNIVDAGIRKAVNVFVIKESLSYTVTSIDGRNKATIHIWSGALLMKKDEF